MIEMRLKGIPVTRPGRMEGEWAVFQFEDSDKWDELMEKARKQVFPNALVDNRKVLQILADRDQKRRAA